MTAHLALIRRHPIKSVGGEGLDEVTLQAARRLPGDREWAVLTEAGERHALSHQTDGQPDRWLPKSCFLRGVVSADLQAVTGGWSEGRLTLSHPRHGSLDLDPATEGARLIDWLRPLWPQGAPAPSRLVRGAAIWTDQKWPWISILSLASLRDLESRTGQSFGTHRWRGNLWVEGWAPFAERDLIGQSLRIGAVEFRIAAHVGRCDATSANTDTGQPDIDMVATLDRLYGHTDFGVFAEVVTGGPLRLQDQVSA
ncbi:MOSC domain-containing protein [Paracoccus gahaiensis]|uniref:MOSC domain-containing protein n=1 Tax=Paracoccus gahaiensis TaxID=1706839 RepID=A0A4U0R6V2_9RHOB|nr:MOSC domain-containing protein [Paracoccus gahaiensis]TJZ90022.1 MOSC domain-containing protein [Paracoccus gahaiensis]